MSTGLTVARIFVPFAIVAAGVAVMGGLIATKPEAAADPAANAGVVVRTHQVKSATTQVTVSAQGTVIPAQEVKLQAEVQGRVVSRSKHLVPGGRFEKGELLLRMDQSEYSLRAQQSAAQVEQAKQQLEIEKSRGELAKEEWQIIGEDQNASEVGRSAALREPQKAEAQARMKSAEHDRNLALLNVSRTTVRAPFNGFVRDGRVEVGQYIAPGSMLCTLVGSDVFWVQVSVPVDRLGRIRVPGFNAELGDGSEVTVWQELGEDRVERSGTVLRLYGDLDPVGRMARLLVEVQDPLALEAPEAERGLPLLLGAYVHVSIGGADTIEAVEIPRSALHSGRFVYVYGESDRLEVREVEIAWRRPDTVLLASGLKDGEEIVVSRLGSAVDGLKLRRSDREPTKPVTPEASEAPAAPEAPQAPRAPQGPRDPGAEKPAEEAAP